MATEKLYSGDGSDKTFDITFPYLTHADIKVSLKELKSDATSPYDANDYHYKDKADPGDYSISGNTVTFTTAPADGTTGGDANLLKNNIKITRATVITSPEHEYSAGSSITAARLNENQKQALYAIEEAGEITATPGGISTGDKGPIFVSSDSSWSMQANSIANTHLQDNSVDTDEIKTNAVTADEIAANAVGSSELADNAVDTNAIQDEAVTLGKMADLDRGKIIYGNASNKPTALTKGSDKQILSSNATDIEWANLNTIRPKGSVIETFTLPCTGASVEVGSGTYTTTAVTTENTVENTWEELEGSKISYKPPADAKQVIYRFSYLATGTYPTTDYTSQGHLLFHTRLMLGTAEVTKARFTGYIANEQANNAASINRYTFEWPFLIRSAADASIGQVAAWNSPQDIKLDIMAYTAYYDLALHRLKYFNGLGYTSDANNPVCVPIISITATT